MKGKQQGYPGYYIATFFKKHVGCVCIFSQIKLATYLTILIYECQYP